MYRIPQAILRFEDGSKITTDGTRFTFVDEKGVGTESTQVRLLGERRVVIEFAARKREHRMVAV